MQHGFMQKRDYTERNNDILYTNWPIGGDPERSLPERSLDFSVTRDHMYVYLPANPRWWLHQPSWKSDHNQIHVSCSHPNQCKYIKFENISFINDPSRETTRNYSWKYKMIANVVMLQIGSYLKSIDFVYSLQPMYILKLKTFH